MLSPCVGRAATLDRVHGLLSDARWVTLVGAPGCGKTLLARHAAAARPRSVWVTGSRESSVDGLVQRCLDALGAELAPADSPVQALQRTVDEQDLLLVLDGVEAMDGLGAILQQVIDGTSRFQLLCTAVTMAGQPAERAVRVGPLPVPRPGEPLEGPAVELLLARVAAAGGHPVNLATHERNVRRLLLASGGLPLLIEQLGVQIALVGLSDVTPTASLAEAVHASYELLDEDQKRCFRRLAIMTHPVGLDVVADITGVTRAEAAQLAAALARRSLVEVHSDGRFDMLEPIREHAISLTAETDDRAHATAGLLRWAERVTPSDSLSGAGDASWLGDLGVLRQAIAAACADDRTRDVGYQLANNIFSSLYTAMRARDAVEILQLVLASGDGPPEIGAQVARRAGIAASEVGGTYEGMSLLARAEEHALVAPNPDYQRAANASIRAEMHLDAGALDRAQAEAERTLALSDDPYLARQARRTLVDIHYCRGDFETAQSLAELVMADAPRDEQWMAISARIIMGRIAADQGRLVEAAAIAKVARDHAVELAEDRMALLADTLFRAVEDAPRDETLDYEWLPWGVRLDVQVQDARALISAGECRRASGVAADVIVLADNIKLCRAAIEGRLVLGDALAACGETGQATAAYLGALRLATECRFPLRAADALDALDRALAADGSPSAGRCGAAARALRAQRGAVPRPAPVGRPAVTPARHVPPEWVADDQFTDAGVAAVTALFQPDTAVEDEGSPLAVLTRSERSVAALVAQGLTNRQIAEQLFVSPRTVDAHLAHIFRKLDISSRARLAALMVDHDRGQQGRI